MQRREAQFLVRYRGEPLHVRFEHLRGQPLRVLVLNGCGEIVYCRSNDRGHIPPTFEGAHLACVLRHRENAHDR